MPYDTEILSPELPIGHKLKDIYTITRTLGQGGFGITYLATEDVTERRVVVKENFPAEFSIRNNNNHHAGPAGAARKENYDWALGAFLNEAKILTQLNHPNIVPVLTAFKALGTAYYVMDYIGGQPLHKAAPQQITEKWLLGILHPMLHALHYIHTLPEVLLHRDIKPDNILVTPEDTPILIDFGAARSVISTHTHSKVGTPGYSPPEQLSNTTAPGPWTDLYALGATCYYLLTGQNPPDYHDRMFAAPGSDLLVHRTELQKRFSPELLTSIDKAFALLPTDRWQSAQEWMAAIDSSYNTTATPVNGTRVPTIEEPAPTPKITQQAAQAELQRRGISAEEYDSKLYDAAKDGDAELVKLLITAGVDVNKADKDGRTPLIWAAYYGHAECVKLLINAGADVNMADEWGQTPLLCAASSGHTECVKLLITAGADVNRANKNGTAPLNCAAYKGRTECVKLLIDAGADVNKADEDSWTPLYPAAYKGHTDCVKLLIATGADVNKADKNGNTPLLCAALKGRTECVKQLIDAGADVNKADKDGWTPLYWAAEEGHTECVKQLLAAGADVNKANEKGETPLFWAAYEGHTDCVKLLIDAGANVNKANEKGETPLYKAEEGGHTECAELLRAAGNTRVPTIEEPAPTPKITQQAAQAEQQRRGISAGGYDIKLLNAAKYGDAELVKLLIAAGADVNMADKYGYTPLSRAADNGHTECVKLLIDAGADVNKASHYGSTPLYKAAYYGHTECVKLLIYAGADVNMANENGFTPLYWAASNGHTECVKLLIAAGADVNKADEEGKTPLYKAASYGETDCVKLLIAAEADVNKADKEGKTPLYKAEERGHTECAELLRAAGNTGGMGGFFKRLFS